MYTFLTRTSFILAEQLLEPFARLACARLAIASFYVYGLADCRSLQFVPTSMWLLETTGQIVQTCQKFKNFIFAASILNSVS